MEEESKEHLIERSLIIYGFIETKVITAGGKTTMVLGGYIEATKNFVVVESQLDMKLTARQNLEEIFKSLKIAQIKPVPPKERKKKQKVDNSNEVS